MRQEDWQPNEDRWPVVLYSGPGCPGSDRARRYLLSRGIPFREIDLSEARQQWQELLKKGIFATPCLRVRDRYLIGFDAGEVEQLLGALD